MSHVTPRCCADGRRFIRLSFHDRISLDHEDVDAYMKEVTSTPPVWVITARTNEHETYEHETYGTEHTAQVVFCMFCGVAMPEVRLRKRPLKRVQTIVDGGYYCATCERRLDSCACPSSVRLWGPVK